MYLLRYIKYGYIGLKYMDKANKKLSILNVGPGHR